MHYYKFNIGDYASHTRHLSLMEDLAYRRLLDAAYTSEKPLTKDTHSLSRIIGMREHQSEVEDVLREFFDEVEEGWIHGRVLKEIDEASGRSDKAKIAAKARWECKRNANAMQPQCLDDATSINENATSTKNDATQDPLHTTQDQLPNTHKKPISSPKGSRYSADSILTAKWGNIALDLRPDWTNDDVRVEYDAFKDYWTAKPGKDGVKLDWLATWRNWCRNSKRKGESNAV